MSTITKSYLKMFKNALVGRVPQWDYQGEMSRKDDILDACVILFAEKGYSGTSTSDISKAIGLSPSAGGIYRHFTSKEEILRAIVIRSHDLVGNMKYALKLNPDFKKSGRQEYIKSCLSALYEQFDGLRLYFKIMKFDAPKIPALNDLMRDEMRTQSVKSFSYLFGYFLQEEKRENVDLNVIAHILFDSFIDRTVTDSARQRLTLDAFLDGWTEILESCLVRAESSPVKSS